MKSYLASKALIPPSQYFNSGNRGYPDVSALGDAILTIIGGKLPNYINNQMMEPITHILFVLGEITVIAGTSASAPIFSGLVTLLNDFRLNTGKKPLGFLNPMLYQAFAANPKTFNAVTTGDNRGTEGSYCKYGYGCWNGWSPVTGLGTPNYAALLDYIKTLP